jgi:TIR domain
MATATKSRSARKQIVRPATLAPVERLPIGADLVPQTSVFISYRRLDTAAAAAHLHASLARRLGSKNIFRDLATIEPGQDFPSVIDRAIRGTNVLIALIGRRWLVMGRNRRPRLQDPNDFVRLEIESALRQGITLIPVLVDGAKMPQRGELPPSIADLADRNAYELPWHEGVARLTRRIGQIEREEAEREATERAKNRKLDLTRGRRLAVATGRSKSAAASFDSVIGAMELSLARQGHRVVLDPKDLANSLKKITGTTKWFLFADMVYVIDTVGVKANGSNDRYVARSYPFSSLEKLPAQLALGRPVLTNVTVYQSWFQEPSSKTGFIDQSQAGRVMGGVVGVAVGWDPEKEQLKLLLPWPTWGKKGVATLTKAAVTQSVSIDDFRAIEASLMPTPSTVPLSKTMGHSKKRSKAKATD